MIGISSTFHHAREVIHGRLGVAGPNAFDEGTDDVVMGLPRLVVVRMRLLHPFGHRLIGDHPLACFVGLQAVNNQFEGVEQATRIASTCPQQGFLLFDSDAQS